MPNTNIVILEGHLAKEPTSKELGGGVVVCNFTVAISDGKDKPATFLSCKIFGTQATALAMSGYTGDVVSLKGKIQIRKWEEKYYTDILVDHMHIQAKKAKKVENEFVAE
jgi:single-stranded DNA-binding protein